jgi:hypothetical protein
MLRIRRNFYPLNAQPYGLDVIVEIHKGYYAAPRLSEVSSSTCTFPENS